MNTRPCPRCGANPKTVYPPREYATGRVPATAYCSACRRTYAANLVDRKARRRELVAAREAKDRKRSRADMEPRVCPRCGELPQSVYEPKWYRHPDGKMQESQDSYCGPCHLTFKQQKRANGKFVKPYKRKKRSDDLTLDDVLADPSIWQNATMGSDGSNHKWRIVRRVILERDGGLCQIREHPKCLGVANQVDHIVPRRDGGSSHPDNLRASCSFCNGTGEKLVRQCLDCGSTNVKAIR